MTQMRMGFEKSWAGVKPAPTVRCGLYFGSFNPLHIGHLAIANYVLEFTDLDELRLVLSPKNPMKSDEGIMPVEERLRRIERAVEQSALPIGVSKVEFDLPKPYYTINTLRYLAAQEPHVCFVLMMGADNLAVIEKWHQWQQLLQEFEVYVYPRSGYDGVALCETYGTRYIDAPLMDVSSSFIRKGLEEGRNMNGFLAGV
ncbi:MAG: nicotinate (nicotinamide) nucleotide adenylyltransferase [Bacteroidales bacterium]|nr:nicotinate (nicotinamide) nucleotide adenylyltransferase [Bacteroidales bacterium]